jgi:hypothetical protein
MRALRKRDPGAAKPYNFALSPILVEPSQDCTLVAPFSKRPEKWFTRPYAEIHSGDQVYLSEEYKGKKLLPQTLFGRSLASLPAPERQIPCAQWRTLRCVYQRVASPTPDPRDAALPLYR